MTTLRRPFALAFAMAACGGTSTSDDGASAGGSSGVAGSGAAGVPGGASGGPGAGAGNAGGNNDHLCLDTWQFHAMALEDAKACDPAVDSDQCSHRVHASPGCECETSANPANADALAALAYQEQQFQALCSADCGPCAKPIAAYCSDEGRCEDIVSGISCKVGGSVYPSGASGISDPVSCNECECTDGNLACTERYCPIPCPDGTAYTTQCAACGPVDDCPIVEHACLPTCTDACEEGSCLDGVCRSLCG